MSGPRITTGSDSKQDQGTPWELIRVIEELKGRPFTIDLAAQTDNAKTREYYTEQMDSLSIPWAQITPDAMAWLNPPFKNIGDWAKKCSQETGMTIYLLVPASIGSLWYREHVYPYATTYALYPRLPFDGWHETPFPKDCILCEYGPDARPTIVEPLEWITPAEALACREHAYYNTWQRYKKQCKDEKVSPMLYENWVAEGHFIARTLVP